MKNNQSKGYWSKRKKSANEALISSNEDEIVVSLMFWGSVQIYTLYHPSGGVAPSNSSQTHRIWEPQGVKKLSAYLL